MSSRRLVALTFGILIAGAAQAQDAMPSRKPGLWQVNLQMQGAAPPPMSSQQCIDAKTDAQMMRQALQQGPGQCTHGAMRKTSDGWEMESTCKTPEGLMRSQMRMSGDPQSRYRMDMKARYDPPLKGRPEMQMLLQAEWKGACPAGMKPGDVRMGGMTMNPATMGNPAQMRQMKPEELKKMMEQLKATQGQAR